MSVRSREEIQAQIEALVGDITSDAGIALIEDIADTFADLEGRATGDGTDWQAEAQRIDKEWREKYVKRFKSGGEAEEDEDKPADDAEKQYTYDNLFK